MRTYWMHHKSESAWATDDNGDQEAIAIDRQEYLDFLLTEFHQKPGPKRVVVFGGRDFTDAAFMGEMLDDFHAQIGFSVLIEGEARGADLMARDWAERHDIPVERFPADWNRLGSFAGPTRNLQIILDGKPDCGIAFKGGSGTDNMKSQCELFGVPVFSVDN